VRFLQSKLLKISKLFLKAIKPESLKKIAKQIGNLANKRNWMKPGL